MTTPELHEDVARQIADLNIDPDRPIVISDADEVVLQFVAGLEAFLDVQSRPMFLDLTSFALTGNIRYADTAEALDAVDVKALLASFFEQRTEHLSPVPGAAEALAAISSRAQIVILSNVPIGQRDARQRSLQRHGMNFPVIANSGAKGPAVAQIVSDVMAPAFFLDDIPHNITSVAQASADVVRMHFVADPRLARLVDPPDDCHFHGGDWPTARAFIEVALAERGY